MNVARRLGTTLLSSMDFIVHYVRGAQLGGGKQMSTVQGQLVDGCFMKRIILSTHMEIVMSKYKDFYEPISIMESKIYFFFGAQMMVLSVRSNPLDFVLR